MGDAEMSVTVVDVLLLAVSAFDFSALQMVAGYAFFCSMELLLFLYQAINSRRCLQGHCRLALFGPLQSPHRCHHRSLDPHPRPARSPLVEHACVPAALHLDEEADTAAEGHGCPAQRAIVPRDRLKAGLVGY